MPVDWLTFTRVIYQVYKLTESVTKRILLRAEESILEVNA